MALSYPIEITDASLIFENNETQKGGFYPLGANNLWHSGIHLHGYTARAIYDGEILACRLDEEYCTDDLGEGDSITYSRNFVLVKHHLIIDEKGVKNAPAFISSMYDVDPYLDGLKGEVYFYTLYMHLAPTNIYDITIPAPEFMNTKICEFICNTEEDTLGGESGLNVRSSPNGSKIGLLKYGETVHFENPLDFINNPGGWKKINPTPYGAGSAYIFCSPKSGGGERIKKGDEKDIPKNEIVVFDNPVKVTAGEYLGYCGKYGPQENMFHVEIFLDNVMFMDMDPESVDLGKIYFFEKDFNEFKKGADFEKIHTDFYEGSQFYSLDNADGAYKVKVKKANLWIEKSKLHWIDSISRYKWKDTVSEAVGYMTDIGNASDAMEVSVSSSDEFKFPGWDLAKTVGGIEYRKIQVSVKYDGAVTGWLSKKQMESKVNWEYSAGTLFLKVKTGAQIAHLYKTNPEEINFTSALGESLTKPLEVGIINGGIKEVKDNDNVEWLGFTIKKEFLGSGSEDVTGWIKKTDAETKIINYFDWKKFFDKLEPESDGDSLCDNSELVNKIENAAQYTGSPYDPDVSIDNSLTSEELLLALQDESIAAELRRMVVCHPTEWSNAVNYDKFKDNLKDLYLFNDNQVNKLMTHIENMQWWEEVQTKSGNQLPSDSKKIWYFHPIALIEHLKKLKIGIPKVEMLIDHEAMDYWFDKTYESSKNANGNFARSLDDIIEVTIHHTEGNSNWLDSKGMIYDGWPLYGGGDNKENYKNGISLYNYFLQKDGTLVECAPLTRWYKHSHANIQDKYHVGIEISHSTGPFTDEQYNMLFAFIFDHIASLCMNFKRISCHAFNKWHFTSGGTKECPSKDFLFSKLVAEMTNRGMSFTTEDTEGAYGDHEYYRYTITSF
ncbi:MAG: N-acetylmuramoyl-L-alanine amidase [Spirochaetales bacterium]|nr:N-acetylmuramoyl-L-alanine amidase [Spirochaetales bacterium]